MILRKPLQAFVRPAATKFLSTVLALVGALFSLDYLRWSPLDFCKGWAVIVCLSFVSIFAAALCIRSMLAMALGSNVRYSLRSLLLFVCVVATLVGWLATDIRRATTQAETVRMIEETGGVAGFSIEDCIDRVHGGRPQRCWLKRLFGDDFFDDVRIVAINENRITDSRLDFLRPLVRLTWLDLSNSPIADADLKDVAGLVDLKGLQLNNTHVTDAGLAYLSEMKKLEILDLDNTGVTDAGLAQLRALPRIKGLGLERCDSITDAGMMCLKQLRRLETLNIRGTKVTDAAVKDLKDAVPTLRDITFNGRPKR